MVQVPKYDWDPPKVQDIDIPPCGDEVTELFSTALVSSSNLKNRYDVYIYIYMYIYIYVYMCVYVCVYI